MEIKFQIVQIAAPLGLIFNLLCQVWGIMFASPSIIDIHNNNLSFFSPEPIFISIGFTSVIALQAYWVWQLIRLNPGISGSNTSIDADIVPYFPINFISNVSIGIWVVFWTNSALKLADFFVLISAASHLAYLFLSPSLNPIAERNNSTISRTTHHVIAAFTGLGVLDLLHNTSIAFAKDVSPGLVVEILTGVGFVVLVTFGDAIFGAFMVFDLLAFSFGQMRYADGWGWSGLLAIYAVVCGMIVAGKRWAWPKYLASRKSGGYGRVAPDEDVDRV